MLATLEQHRILGASSLGITVDARPYSWPLYCRRSDRALDAHREIARGPGQSTVSVEAALASVCWGILPYGERTFPAVCGLLGAGALHGQGENYVDAQSVWRSWLVAGASLNVGIRLHRRLTLAAQAGRLFALRNEQFSIGGVGQVYQSGDPGWIGWVGLRCEFRENRAVPHPLTIWATGFSMDFRTFYDEHFALVWRTLFRLGMAKADLPDAVQEVFLVAFRKLPEFEGRSKPSTWLVGISYRVASDRRRLAHVRMEIGDDPAVFARGDARPGPEAAAEHRERIEILDELLAELRPEQREVFVMFELEELSGKEIAEIVGAPIKTVFSRLRLAREAFTAGTGGTTASRWSNHGARPVAVTAIAERKNAMKDPTRWRDPSAGADARKPARFYLAIERQFHPSAEKVRIRSGLAGFISDVAPGP